MKALLRVETRAAYSGEQSFLLEVFDAVTGFHVGSASVGRRQDMSPENFKKLRAWLESEGR